MRSIKTLTLALCALAFGTTLAGCDKEEDPAQRKSCEDLAKHISTLVQTSQGGTVPQEQVDKMVESTTEKCMEAPPEKAELDCAMAATDLAAMKACDPKFEPSEAAAAEDKDGEDKPKADEAAAEAKPAEAKPAADKPADAAAGEGEAKPAEGDAAPAAEGAAAPAE